jgi:hypothetical protein
MTLLLAFLVAQATENPGADGVRELEKLRAQVRDLQDRVSQLEDASVRDAELIQRLRTAIKTIELATPAPARPEGVGAEKPKEGPRAVLKGRVLHVDTKFNFLLINIGREKNLQPGYRFEIIRKVYSPGNPDPRVDKIGSAEFEKYIGEEESTSKLRVVEGNSADMKLDDEAVAIRALPEVKETKDPKPAEARPVNGVYKITGTAGRPGAPGFTINFGSIDGAKQTDIVFVYKDGVYKNKLRLDSVAKEFSVGNLIQPPNGTTDSPEVGDQVFTRELKKTVAGKVAMIDPNRGQVATDLRQRDGVHVGQRLEIRRLGQKIGILTVTDVQAWGSWAKPDQETKLDLIQKGDFVVAPEN